MLLVQTQGIARNKSPAPDLDDIVTLSRDDQPTWEDALSAAELATLDELEQAYKVGRAYHMLYVCRACALVGPQWGVGDLGTLPLLSVTP